MYTPSYKKIKHVSILKKTLMISVCGTYLQTIYSHLNQQKKEIRVYGQKNMTIKRTVLQGLYPYL